MMSNDDERRDFYRIASVRHARVDPCFMTGKGCVYTDVIDREIKNREPDRLQGFVVMPFRQNIRVFYQNCLSPFIESNYGGKTEHDKRKLELVRGDSMRLPGVVICEGICKRIQESDFIIADISVPNGNVFYELGLAYGIGQKILVIYHSRAKFGQTMAKYFRDECRPYPYQDLNLIRSETLKLSSSMWRRDPSSILDEAKAPRIHLYAHHIQVTDDSDNPPAHEQHDGQQADAQNGKRKTPADGPDDIELDFETQVKSAVGLAIAEIARELEPDSTSGVIKGYRDLVKGLRYAEVLRPEDGFTTIRDQVDRSYCLIVRTGPGCHPLSYLWLGYGHARGKNVIPITVIKKPKDDLNDLAFDIRAQRHMTFVTEAPHLLPGELGEALRHMTRADFTEWSRKRFWDTVLGRRGPVSIFTGTLHNKEFDREMIGDWDLRAASELTSYFGRHQYRAKIETPIYPPRFSAHPDRTDKAEYIDEYIAEVQQMMAGKNCILIASPDVNPLTEIVLGKIYGIPGKKLFSSKTEFGPYPHAIVAVKEKEGGVEESGDAERTFYEVRTAAGEPRRGFRCGQFMSDEKTRAILLPFVSQNVDQEEFEVYAHLAILPNPFKSSDVESEERAEHPHYIIVLNGVSGPATFALTHVLTGGVSEEFVAYREKGFDAQAKSESILKQLLEALRPANRSIKAVECIIKLTVGPLADADRRSAGTTYDWRQIWEWGLAEEAMSPPVRVLLA